MALNLAKPLLCSLKMNALKLHSENAGSLRAYCLTVYLVGSVVVAWSGMVITPKRNNLFPFVRVLSARLAPVLHVHVR